MNESSKLAPKPSVGSNSNSMFCKGPGNRYLVALGFGLACVGTIVGTAIEFQNDNNGFIRAALILGDIALGAASGYFAISTCCEPPRKNESSFSCC